MVNTFREDVAIGVTVQLEEQIAQVADSLLAQKNQAMGARQAFRLAQDRINQLLVRSDKMMEEGDLTEDDRVAWKRALRLAHGSMESLYQTTDVSVHELDGQIKAYSTVLTIAGKQKAAYLGARQALIDTSAALTERDGSPADDGERSAPQGTKAQKDRKEPAPPKEEKKEKQPSLTEIMRQSKSSLQVECGLRLLGTGGTKKVLAQRIKDANAR